MKWHEPNERYHVPIKRCEVTIHFADGTYITDVLNMILQDGTERVIDRVEIDGEIYERRTDGCAYDIYIAADVDNLKAAYAQLWRDYKRVVRENSLLEDEIRRLRERRAYHEKDYTWMTD